MHPFAGHLTLLEPKFDPVRTWEIVERDAVRLREFGLWIKRCAADPRRLATASPVCGAWQLRFDVLLAEPALQRVLVECRRADGSWQTIHGRMTLEFRAEAFNAENRVNFGGPSLNTASPTTFGEVGSPGAARVMQFAGRYEF